MGKVSHETFERKKLNFSVVAVFIIKKLANVHVGINFEYVENQKYFFGQKSIQIFVQHLMDYLKDLGISCFLHNLYGFDI